MEVVSHKKNQLLNREESWLRIEHPAKPTPLRKDIIDLVAKHFKVKENCVIIEKILSESGIASSRVKVLVYAKAEDVPKAKLEGMKIRMGLAKKAEEGKPAEDEAKPAEKPQKEKGTGKE